MTLKEKILFILIIYFIVMGIVGFIQMGLDKSYAKKGKWRIRERTLFLTALAGSSYGSLIAMFVFHHKTKHMSFRILFPLFAILHTAILVAIYFFM